MVRGIVVAALVASVLIPMTAGAAPPPPVEKIVLSPLWTVGGDSADAVLLGIIEQILVGSDGTVYLLDTQLSTVHLIAPDGTYLGTRGRAGDGPGEVRRPVAMTLFPDGTLALVGTFPGKLVLLDTAGEPAGTIAPQPGPEDEGNFLWLRGAQPAADDVVLAGSFLTMNPDSPVQQRRFFLRRYGRDGELRAEYIAVANTFSMRDPLLSEQVEDFVWHRFATAPDGRVTACVPRNRYEIVVIAADGGIERTFGRPYESWTRHDRARDRQRRILEPRLRHLPPGTELVIEDTEPDVTDLILRPGGETWVQTSRAMWEPPAECFTEYDVFDAGGEWVRQVRVVCEGDAMRDRLIFVDEDRAYRVVGYWDAVLQVSGGGEAAGAVEPMAVTCYRVGAGP